MKLAINFVLFQIGWFSVVVSAAQSRPGVGVAVIAFILAYHLYRSQPRGNELLLIFSALCIGLIWDSFMVASGLFIYASGSFVPYLAPYWILAMWALFATTLNLSLRWIKGRFLLAAISGAVFGPLAYYAGYQLGAVEISNMQMAMLVQALGWGMILPLLGGIASWLDKGMAMSFEGTRS
jgi:hypothetical protein